MKAVSLEFFISDVTIVKILDDNYNKVTTLKKEYQGYTKIKFKKIVLNKWRHLSWEFI